MHVITVFEMPYKHKMKHILALENRTFLFQSKIQVVSSHKCLSKNKI